MRTALACGAFAITVACARNYHPDPDMQPTLGTGYTVTTTGAPVGPERAEPESSLGEAAERMAGQICEREVRCHGSAAGGDRCQRLYQGLAAMELGTWECSPAASRARVKQCLTAINAEPCELDLSSRPRMCGRNAECPGTDATLISPGAALADAGL